MQTLVLLVTLALAVHVAHLEEEAVPPKPNRGPKVSVRLREKAAKWKPGDAGPQPWEVSGQFEGDILLDARNGLVEEHFRWPNATIPYYIPSEFTAEQKTLIKEAFEEYHNTTCITFRPYRYEDEAYIYITQKPSGCWSEVGKTKGGQLVNLDVSSCLYHGTILHELMHAVGFWHEHMRSDRDDYVTIHWENIDDEYAYAFEKYGPEKVHHFGVDYDYNSVMHYDRYAFSKNGEPTISAKDPDQDIAYYQPHLTEKDIKKIQSMYKCN